MKQLLLIWACLLFLDAAYAQSKCVPPLPASSARTTTSARLAKINSSLNSETGIVSIEKTSNGTAYSYTATAGGKSFLYTGGNYANLLQAVKPGQLNKKQVYFDLKGFSANDELAFKNSLEIHNKGDIEITTWRREVYNTELQDAFLTRMGTVENLSVSAITIEMRAGKSFYKVVVEYISKQRRNFIEFVSTSREVVAEFARLIKSKLLMKSVTNYSSTADVLRSIKKDINSKYTVNKKEMLTTFRTQEFNKSLIVKCLYTGKKPRYANFVKQCLS
jgi:hypothetical protein